MYKHSMRSYLASLLSRMRAWPIWNTWPNFFTFLRVLAVVPFAIAFMLGDVVAAKCMYIFAFFTDGVDGWLARKLRQVTPFGEWFDRLADKVLHLSVLWLFQQVYRDLWQPLLCISIGALFLTAAPGLVTSGPKKRAGSNWFGKTKMGTEVAAVLLLFNENPNLAYWALWIAFILAIFSFVGHMKLEEGKDYRWLLRWMIRCLLRLQERKI
jgi:CDP-diacylglycerol---glycerol-3-phosphate 3-phosphatidyltransferase